LREDAVRGAAMHSLRRFGRASVLRLRAALAMAMAMAHDVGGIEPPTSVDGRAAVATLLGELGERAPLLLALEDRARSVRVAAAMALAKSAEGPTARTLEVLIQGLDDPSWVYAQSIMEALIPHGRSYTTLLEQRLKDPVSDEASIRRNRRAAVLAGRLGMTSASPLLAALFDADDQELRLAAVHALTQIPASSEKDLAGFLADPALVVALEAFRELRRRGRCTLHEVSHFLKRSSTYHSPWRRWWRLWSLHRAAPHSRTYDEPQECTKAL
jgi:HEAT repeat protein